MAVDLAAENKKLKAQVTQLKKEWEDSCQISGTHKTSRDNVAKLLKKVMVNIERGQIEETKTQLIEEWNKFRSENKWV